jgi:predicted metalloprotease
MELGESSEAGNVEDRRGGGRTLAIGGGIGAVVITIIAAVFGFNPDTIKRLGIGGGAARGPGVQDGYVDFSKKLLGTMDTVWREQFQTNYRRPYEKPTLVLFSHDVDSEGCGIAPSAVGPFYCPRSKKVFLDPTFFDELERKLGGSKAEFSQAYVVAHEVGHHVQNLLGYNSQLESFRSREGENAGIRLELQADYLAGVWAHHADRKFHILSSPSEVQEALKTARAIGDNRIQEKMRGKSWPESFTHGSDAQRYKAFKKGFDTGDASKAALDYFFNPRTRPLDL